VAVRAGRCGGGANFRSLVPAGSGARRVAGDPDLHALRHSYVTHLIEAGYDPMFVQQQVGHSYSSTTALYTSVSSDFKQKTIQRMIARRIARPQEESDV
jgi:integrase/recombinase XerD